MHQKNKPAIWFPTIQAKSGADVFTKRLVEGLKARGYQAEIYWLPHQAEFIPWLFRTPKPPNWANIIHINTWTHQSLVSSKLPIVATIHHCVNDPILRPYKTLLQHLYHLYWIRKIELSSLNRAAMLTTVSKYTALSTSRVYKKSNVSVIPLGIDTKKTFYVNNSRDKPHNPFRLLFVGNWSSRKGNDMLLPIINELGKEFELWIVTGLDNNKLTASPSSNVKFIQNQKDDQELAEIYRSCDALLFPSRLEGFGLVALEAQACGLPVIATNGSALPEVIDNLVTGLLCPKDDIRYFADSIRWLANHEPQWQAMRSAARQHAVRNFSIDKMIEQYIDLYNAILSEEQYEN